MNNELSCDGFLGGAVQIRQPRRGYRSGADAVMLAAATRARPGDSVLELGCGAGAASLCLLARVPDLSLVGVERDPVYADLARDNLALNGFDAEIETADIAALPHILRSRSFDHVLFNPPYFRSGTRAALPLRHGPRHQETPLDIWADTALKRLLPRGTVTVIQRADRLDDVIRALSPRCGDIWILPLAARLGAEAGRVLVTARKSSRGPTRLLAPFVLHKKPSHDADEEDLTPQAQAVLRGKSPILWGEAENR